MKKARAKSEALSKEQFRKALQDLWPVAGGSLSLRKSPCVREHFRSAIEQGQAAPVCRYERGPILESHTNFNADGF
jgi:hypothetical protein